MKPVFRFFLLAFLSILTACGTFEISIDHMLTPDVEGMGTSSESEKKFMQSIAFGATEPANVVGADELGMIYFWLSHTTFDPADPSAQVDMVKLVRLPGSCVLAVAKCPAPEDVPVPFKLYFNSWQPMNWSPDGKMAAVPLAIVDDLTLMTVYVYRPEEESWTEITQFPVMDSLSWSPDGAWLSLRI
jgi:hypothetical protein